uniref:Uncharacterized protein n=1 Tax=Micrurus spixii TaxID=129469 RepID=A0A2D4MCS4_9SAUR
MLRKKKLNKSDSAIEGMWIKLCIVMNKSNSLDGVCYHSVNQGKDVGDMFQRKPNYSGMHEVAVMSDFNYAVILTSQDGNFSFIVEKGTRGSAILNLILSNKEA